MESDGTNLDPAAALGLAASSRSAVADRLVTLWWYYPGLGLLVGGLIAVQAVPSRGLRTVLVGGYAVGLTVLVEAYRRRTGVWISGTTSGPARRWALLGAVGWLSLFVLGVAGQLAVGWIAPVAAGLLAVPVVVVVGRRYDTAMRAQLRSGA